MHAASILSVRSRVTSNFVDHGAYAYSTFANWMKIFGFSATQFRLYLTSAPSSPADAAAFLCDASGWKLTCLTEGCIFSKGQKGGKFRKRASLIHHGTPGRVTQHITCIYIHIFGQQQFRRKRIYGIDTTHTQTHRRQDKFLAAYSVFFVPGLGLFL